MARKKLGEILIERGIIDEDQLNSALAYQRAWGHRLGAALLAKGFVTEGQLTRVLGEELSIPVVDLSEAEPDWDAIRLLDARFCEAHELFPVALDESRGRKRLTCAMGDPLNVAALDEIEFTTGCKVKAVLAPISQIHSAIRRYHHRQRTVIRKVPDRPPARRGTGTPEEAQMTLVRPGGGEERVDTSARERTDPHAGPHLVDDADVVLLTDEVTKRTELADIIRQREARAKTRARQQGAVQDDLDFLLGVSTQDQVRLEQLERRFWTLMRLLAKKGLLDKEAYLKEFEADD